MDIKNMLSDEELEKVNGGFEYEGQEYDSVQLLDQWIDMMNGGDYLGCSNIWNIILHNQSQFVADIEKAGRTVPGVLLEEFPLD